jgi:hypothetical protein
LYVVWEIPCSTGREAAACRVTYSSEEPRAEERIFFFFFFFLPILASFALVVEKGIHHYLIII